MKHSFKFAMLVAAVVAFVGCSKEQSSFNVEDIPGSAKIEGTLTYDAGWRKISNSGSSYSNFEEYVRDAADVRVTVKILNSQLSNRGASDGYTTYETKTNASGEFSVTVPALDKGTRVEVVASPFYAGYYERKYDDYGRYYIASENVLYKVSSFNTSVIPNDIVRWDAQFTKSTY